MPATPPAAACEGSWTDQPSRPRSLVAYSAMSARRTALPCECSPSGSTVVTLTLTVRYGRVLDALWATPRSVTAFSTCPAALEEGDAVGVLERVAARTADQVGAPQHEQRLGRYRGCDGTEQCRGRRAATSVSCQAKAPQLRTRKPRTRATTRLTRIHGRAAAR